MAAGVLSNVLPRPPNNEALLDEGGLSQSWLNYFNALSDNLNGVTPPSTTTAGTYPVGIVDGSDAAPGMIGEVLEVVLTSPVSLTTDVAADVLTLPLSPGDWDVSGWIAIELDAGSASATVRWGIDGIDAGMLTGVYTTLIAPSGWTGPVRRNVAATASVVLRTLCLFTAGTATAVSARLRARRMR